MAIAGVLAGYLPYHLWGRGRGAARGDFRWAARSRCWSSAVLALAELLISGVRMPASGAGSFAGAVRGLGADRRRHHAGRGAARSKPSIRTSCAQPAAGGRSPWWRLGLAAVLLAAGGVVFASTAPDGIEKLAHSNRDLRHRRTALISTPLKDYAGSMARRRLACAGGRRTGGPGAGLRRRLRAVRRAKR